MIEMSTVILRIIHPVRHHHLHIRRNQCMPLLLLLPLNLENILILVPNSKSAAHPNQLKMCKKSAKENLLIKILTLLSIMYIYFCSCICRMRELINQKVKVILVYFCEARKMMHVYHVYSLTHVSIRSIRINWDLQFNIIGVF